MMAKSQKPPRNDFLCKAGLGLTGRDVCQTLSDTEVSYAVVDKVATDVKRHCDTA